ncbi:hypothetical protein IWQ61_009767 [Dispira simplex]|nr:hypothetical protein IWQ61_009767 [Dispira simplex]
MEHAVESKFQPAVWNLVSNVVGFKELGEYEDVADTVEELVILSKKRPSITDKKKGLDPQKRRLCESANNWFKPNAKGPRKTGTERAFYSFIADYILLIGIVLEETKCIMQGMAIQRRILPHQECDIGCDAKANIPCNIVLRCCGSDVDVEQEHEPFENDPNLSYREFRPRNKIKVGEPKPTKEEELHKFQKRIKKAFGVIEVKKSAAEDGIFTTYAQLGWYIRCALDAQFDRNSMWGITVCGPLVRFVLFTHSTVIPSLPIDMGTSEGRKQFVDDYIRLSLCPKYRVGYDPTKTWFPRYNRWEVECFDINQSNNQQGAKDPCESVYVDPEPITSGGYLFGRRTRCHPASLPKRGELAFVLKESWTEVDGTINKVEVPNEVRIFKHIEKIDLTLKYPLTENSIPKMKYGGAVCIRKEYVHGDTGQTGQWCYDTMSSYCGEPKVVTDRSPSTSQGESAKSENPDEPKEWVERVHQRLLLTPVVENEMPDPKAPKETVTILDPLLIDFDHARHKDDNVADQMLSRMGTLPFMSILNLAGHAKHLTFIDECESFLYLFVWKYIIGFSRCQMSLTTTTKPKKTATGKNATSHTPLSKGVTGGSKEKAALDPAKANPVVRGEAKPA